jgi:hypothetical protein
MPDTHALIFAAQEWLDASASVDEAGDSDHRRELASLDLKFPRSIRQINFGKSGDGRRDRSLGARYVPPDDSGRAATQRVKNLNETVSRFDSNAHSEGQRIQHRAFVCRLAYGVSFVTCSALPYPGLSNGRTT